MHTQNNEGVTLLELAMVLTIVGLIMGGILVGRDLIRSAAVRATISQVESYKRAVANFQYKFNALPGDINSQLATQYSLSPRGTSAGEGDGNGLIQSNQASQPPYLLFGEPLMFWVDLTSANGLNLNLIDGSFNTATSTQAPGPIGGTQIALYLPPAKIGNGNYFYVWSGGAGWSGLGTGNNNNYFGLSAITNLFAGYGAVISSPNIPVAQAYAIDSKIDDGLPGLGAVTIQYLNSGAGYVNGSFYGNSTTSPSSKTCADDAGTNSPISSYKYTMSINNGAGANCALSFQF